MEDDDFLAAVEADNANASEPEPVKVEVVEEPKAETPPEPEAKVETPAEPAKAEPEVLELTPADIAPPGTDAKGQMAPITALLDERDKRKAAEAERDALRAQRQQPAVQMPDPYEDPEGFAAAQQAQVGQALYQTNLRWSERIATVEHGAETVKAAKDWGFAKCESDPYFNAKVAASEDPVGFVVQEWKREEIASKVTPQDFEQFQAWKAAQSQLSQGAQAPPQVTAPSIPPKSLASAPSAGSILTEPIQDSGEIFDEVMPQG